MIKSTICTILATGYSKTNKSINEVIGNLYPLQDIFKVKDDGGIICNNNAFWKPENSDNRKELIADIKRVKKFNIVDSRHIELMDRLANGDKYGIETL